MREPTELPAGLVTFLFTDIEGSTALLNAHADAYRSAVRRHHELLLQAVHAASGTVFETVGDAVYAAFARPFDAVQAALDGQLALAAEPFGPTPIRVRMGLHSGAVELRDRRYFGLPLVRCARLMSIGHGGQVLLSAATAGLLQESLPDGVSLVDMGVHRLKDLVQPEHVWQLAHASLPLRFRPLRSLTVLPNNLPAQISSFVGREPELAEVKRLLAAARLLTLTGVGGTGKTRLALQVAADVLEDFPDGVWLVDLAPLSEPDLVLRSIAIAVGVREEPGQPLTDTITSALRGRDLLLLLDNCEHLIARCAEIAETLVHACPKLRILTTSREPFGIAGETTWRVPPLRVADPEQRLEPAAVTQYEAVRLFIDRATAVEPHFAVTNQSAPAVAQICWRLDGIPLAIELAAARIKVLTPEQIASRLDDRFRLLTAGSRTAVPRQQTLRALVDWSHDLLSPQEQALFRRLSTFAGGWSLEAAEAVCAGEAIAAESVLDLLSKLVDKSLVLADEQPDGRMRYRLLETLREYAAERLEAAAESEGALANHARYYVEQLERLDAYRWAADWGTWEEVGFPWFNAELDNLRAALGRCRDRLVDPDGSQRVGLRLCNGLWWLWMGLGRIQETWDWHQAELAAAPFDMNVVYAWAVWGAGIVGTMLSRFDRSEPQLQQALSMARELGDPPLMAAAIGGLGEDLMHQGRLEEARPLLEQSLDEVRTFGPRCYLPIVYYNPARLAFIQGRLDDAGALLDQAIAAARSMRFRNMLELVLTLRGMVYVAQGQLDQAEAVLVEAERTSPELSGLQVNLAPLGLGQLALIRGDLDEAERQLSAMLQRARATGFRMGMCETLTSLAFLGATRGPQHEAIQLFSAADRLRKEIKTPLQPDDRQRVETALEGLRAATGEDAFQLAWQSGQAMALETAISLGLGHAPA